MINPKKVNKYLESFKSSDAAFQKKVAAEVKYWDFIKRQELLWNSLTAEEQSCAVGHTTVKDGRVIFLSFEKIVRKTK